MKWIGALAVFAAVSGAAQVPVAKPTASGDDRAEQIIQSLDMRPLPREGGLRGVIGRVMPELATPSRPLAVESRHYTLLTSTLPTYFLHQFESSETSVLVEGGPVEYYVFCPNGHVDKQVVSREYAAAEEPLAMVPSGCWQAAQLAPGASYALMVTTLAPEWTSDRFRVGAGVPWINRFAGKKDWATPDFLRKLIGPNLQ